MGKRLLAANMETGKSLYKRFMDEDLNYITGQSGKVDLKERLITFSFSSDNLIDHFWVRITLNHDKDAVNFERLKKGAGFYDNHNYQRYLGDCVDGWIENGKGHSTVKMSRSEMAQGVLDDMVDGLRTGVSMGFEIDEWEFEEEPEDGGSPIIHGLRWTPFELTTTGIPADISVGLGRKKNKNSELSTMIEEGVIMGKRFNKGGAEAGDDGGSPVSEIENLRREKEQMFSENQRIEEILAIGNEFEQMTMANEFIRDKKTTKEFSRSVMESLRTKPEESGSVADPDDIGLTNKEKRKFSILRAIKAVTQGNWDLAPFEKEVSDAAGEKYGKRSADDSLIIPTDILNGGFTRAIRGTRAGIDGVVDTTDVAGALDITVDGDNFIEALRAMTVADKLGCTWLTHLSGTLQIPKQTVASAAEWGGEADDGNETGVKVGSIELNPETIGANIPVTRKTLMNSSFSMEMFLRRDIFAAIAYQVSHALIIGGANKYEPKGVLKASGISNYEITAKLTHEHILWLEAEVTSKNVDGNSWAYICSPHVRQVLKGTKRSDGTMMPLWETGKNGEGFMNGYRSVVTTMIPVASDKKTSLVFGLWEDAIIAHWGAGIELQINPFSKNGNITLRALLDADVKFRHKDSFAYLSGIPIITGAPANLEKKKPSS